MDANRRRERELEGEEDRHLAERVEGQCFDFLRPFMKDLDEKLDVRLVRTLADGVTAIVRNRNRPAGLLLSELGGLIAGPKHAPAGTKRLDRLIKSERWEAKDVGDHLLEEGMLLMLEEARGVPEGRALCVLDSGVLEKPESREMEGLCPVRSAKARRIGRPRPKMGKGYYRGKPGGPIVVPGFEWTSAMITGWAARDERRPVALAAWHWYAKPKPAEGDVQEAGPAEGDSAEPDPVLRQRGVEAARAVLAEVSATLGKDKLLHVWDRGFSGAAWLSEAMDEGLAFVVRWKKGNKLRPAEAPSVGDQCASAYRREQDGIPAWKLTRGLRNWGTRKLADPRNPHRPISVSFAAREVRLLHRDEPLYLVVVRLGKDAERKRGGSEPWRLLTNQPVRTAQECLRIAQAYAARWAIEQEQRFGKSELGIESVRVRGWEARGKLLAIASLAYAFLVQLLGDCTNVLIPSILRWAHRTGRQASEAYRSLYRLRAALANLWNSYAPVFRGWP
jgi:hypothetical protein